MRAREITGAISYHCSDTSTRKTAMRNRAAALWLSFRRMALIALACYVVSIWATYAVLRMLR